MSRYNLKALIHIGIRCATKHKKHSFFTIITLSVLLSLLFLFNMLLTSTSEVISQNADIATKNKTYTRTALTNASPTMPAETFIEKQREIIESHNGQIEFTTKLLKFGHLEPPSDEYSDPEYVITTQSEVIKIEDANQLFVLKAKNTTDDKISTVINLKTAIELYEASHSGDDTPSYGMQGAILSDREYINKVIENCIGKPFSTNNDAAEHIVLGVIPGGVAFNSLMNSVSNSFQYIISDALLWFYGNSSGITDLIIDDGSPATTKYINSANQTSEYIISSFSNKNDAYEYARIYNNIPEGISTTYYISPFIGNQLNIAKGVDETWHGIGYILLSLFLVLFIIHLSTFLQIKSKDSTAIQTYIHTGSSCKQLVFIYLSYFLFLSIIAIILALLIAAITTMIIFATFSEQLTRSVSIYYLIDGARTLTFPKLNISNFIFISIGVLAPPCLCIPLSLKTQKTMSRIQS